MTLTWTKSPIGGEYRIFRGKVIAGLFKTSLWKGNAYGELNGYMLTFKHKGFFKSETIIFDIEGKNQLGCIKYNFWKQRAEIKYEDEVFLFGYISWTHRSWEVKKENDLATFKSIGFWRNKGEIDSEGITGAVLLCAFYAHGYFSRMNSTASA
jgi:hypothetical protein